MLLSSKLSTFCIRASYTLCCSATSVIPRCHSPQKNHEIYVESSNLGQKFIFQPFATLTTVARRYSTDAESESTKDKETKSTQEERTSSSEKSEDDIRVEILENALNYVTTHGWTRESLSLGAKEAGYPSVAEGLFGRGEVDLVLYLVKSNNTSLVKYMEEIIDAQESEKMKTSEFIRDVLEHRLRMIIPYIDVWSDAMAILLQPSVVVEATQDLGKMVDDIWFYAGDESTDFNWYTKRGLLAKLFVTTQTVLVNDQSPDFTDTWKFLDRRMNDIATFGRVTNSFRKSGKMASDVAFAGFTVLRNVSGFGERRR